MECEVFGLHHLPASDVLGLLYPKGLCSNEGEMFF